MTNEEARACLEGYVKLFAAKYTTLALSRKEFQELSDAIRQMLAENERLRWLSDPDENSMIQELQASIASAVCHGCGYKTIHDGGVAIHWCEECVAEKVAALEAECKRLAQLVAALERGVGVPVGERDQSEGGGR